jgi:hypothetical protein
MQTYLPQIGYASSMRRLHDYMLERQIVHTIKILKILEGEQSPWSRHPAVRMWRGYERSLCQYGNLACLEWRIGRRRQSHLDILECGVFFTDLDNELRDAGIPARRPPWVGDTDICRSHRSNLIRKYPDQYAAQYPNTPELMPFLWPLPAPNDPRGYRVRLSEPDLRRLLEGERKLPAWLEWNPHRREVLPI